MALAGLVRHRRHAAMEELAGVADHVIPLEGRTGVHLVGLNVEMAEHALVGLELGIRQFLADELAGGVPRVVAFDLRQRLAERRRELDQRLVLLGRVIVLHQFLALDHAGDRLGARRMADEVLGADAAVADTGAGW